MDKDRSNLAPRAAYSRHATSSTSSSNTRVLKMVTEMGSHSVSGLTPALSSGAAATLLESREREKKEMQDLNDRLAGYIEKVRFLEAQNRKLAEDLGSLRGRWGKDTSSIKSMYETELSEARKLIDDTARDKNALESQIHRLQQDIIDYRKKYDDVVRSGDADREKVDSLTNQLSDAEAEISLLRRRIKNLEDDIGRLKAENGKILDDLQKTRHDLDQETLNRIDYQNQVQTLLEEIDFLNRVHDEEVKDLQTLIIKDPTREYREYFKDDLSAAIRDIRLEYDDMAQRHKMDMESWYKLKVQEVQTTSNRHIIESSFQKEETKRLRDQLGDLRGKLGDLETKNSILEKQSNELTYQLEDDQRQYEMALNERDSQIRKMRDDCQSLMVELQSLLDTKRTLDTEIAIYRKMLEGEENRDGLKQLVDQMMSAHTVRQHEDEEKRDQTSSSASTTAKSTNREISYSRKRNEKGEIEETLEETPGGGIKGPAAGGAPSDDRPFTPTSTGSFSKYGHLKERGDKAKGDEGGSIKEEEAEDHRGGRGPAAVPPTDTTSGGKYGHVRPEWEKPGDAPTKGKKTEEEEPKKPPSRQMSTGTVVGMPSGVVIDHPPKEAEVRETGGDHAGHATLHKIPAGPPKGVVVEPKPQPPVREEEEHLVEKKVDTTAAAQKPEPQPSKYGHIKPQSSPKPQETPPAKSRPSVQDPAGVIVVPVLPYEGSGNLDHKSYPHREEHVAQKTVKPSTAAPVASPDDEKHDSYEESMKVVKGEMATRTSFQRSAKGNVSIAECHPEGKYIVLENTHRSKDESLDDWKLKRNVDGKLDLEYQFPPRTTIKAGKTIRIWARNQGGINNPPDNIIFDAADSWGLGSNVQTSLHNKEGEERATHVQRTSQQSTATI